MREHTLSRIMLIADQWPCPHALDHFSYMNETSKFWNFEEIFTQIQYDIVQQRIICQQEKNLSNSCSNNSDGNLTDYQIQILISTLNFASIFAICFFSLFFFYSFRFTVMFLFAFKRKRILLFILTIGHPIIVSEAVHVPQIPLFCCFHEEYYFNNILWFLTSVLFSSLVQRPSNSLRHLNEIICSSSILFYFLMACWIFMWTSRTDCQGKKQHLHVYYTSAHTCHRSTQRASKSSPISSTAHHIQLKIYKTFEKWAVPLLCYNRVRPIPTRYYRTKSHRNESVQILIYV